MSEQVATDRVKVGHRVGRLIGPIADTGRGVVIFDDAPSRPVVVELSAVEREDAPAPIYRHRESRA